MYIAILPWLIAGINIVFYCHILQTYLFPGNGCRGPGDGCRHDATSSLSQTLTEGLWLDPHSAR